MEAAFRAAMGDTPPEQSTQFVTGRPSDTWERWYRELVKIIGAGTQVLPEDVEGGCSDALLEGATTPVAIRAFIERRKDERLKRMRSDSSASPVSRSFGRSSAPSQAFAAATVLWDRYKTHQLLTIWQPDEYARIGAELVAAGHYASHDEFMTELALTKPWTLKDAKQDRWAVEQIAERLGIVHAAAS